MTLFHLIVGRRFRNLRVVPESVEPDQLDSGVLEVNPRVKIVQYTAKVAGIGGKGLETVSGKSNVERMPRSEGVFSITEILPAVVHPHEHTQIRIYRKGRERIRLHAPVRCIPLCKGHPCGRTLVAVLINFRALAFDEPIFPARIIKPGL